MTEDRLIITWEEFKRIAGELANIIKAKGEVFTSIFGIPKGGIPVAIELSNLLNLPIVGDPIEGTLVVDDVIDSGKTVSKYLGNRIAVLHFKPHSPIIPDYYYEQTEAWVDYPWEVETNVGVEENIKRILEFIGEDPTREGLLETPQRVMRAYTETLSGYGKDPKDFMKVFDSNGYDEVVICKDIEFYSYCEHHMVPFYGKVHIAYLPNQKVIGLSKLARIVDVFAKRLQIQEKMTKQIADAIMEGLNPKGVGVIVEGKHLCMMMRGVCKQNSSMTTSCMLGDFRENPSLKAEVMDLFKVK